MIYIKRDRNTTRNKTEKERRKEGGKELRKEREGMNGERWV